MEAKKRILLVDDEQINLEFFEVMLSNLGFEISMAEDGQEALNSVRKLKPDLVILDNVMPKLSGWEVTRTIKTSPEFAEFANTPIIMLSAMDDIKDKVEGLELGADDYITKPFNFAEVLARIRAVLRTHDLMSQIANRESQLSIKNQELDELRDAFEYAHSELENIAKENDIEKTKSIAVKANEELIAIENRLVSFRIKIEELEKQATDIATLKKDISSSVSVTN